MSDEPELRDAIRRHPTSLGPARSRWRRRPLVLLAGALGGVAVVASLLAFGLARDEEAIRSPLIGKAAPAFDLQTLDGRGHLALRELRGQVVVLNFWASWCTECRIEHPALGATWELYRDRGVVVVGVLYQDSLGPARTYAREQGGDWPLAVDPGGRTALAYGVYGVPETFVIGPDGRIASKHVGPVTFDLLRRQIDRLRAGP